MDSYLFPTATSPHPWPSPRQEACFSGNTHISTSQKNQTQWVSKGFHLVPLTGSGSHPAFPTSINGNITCVVPQARNFKAYSELLSLSPSPNMLSVPGPTHASSEKRPFSLPLLHTPVLSLQPIPAQSPVALLNKQTHQ